MIGLFGLSGLTGVIAVFGLTGLTGVIAVFGLTGLTGVIAVFGLTGVIAVFGLIAVIGLTGTPDHAIRPHLRPRVIAALSARHRPVRPRRACSPASAAPCRSRGL